MEVKTIDPTKREFTANGNKYFITEKISILRYKQYEKLVPVLTFGLSFSTIYSNLGKAFALLNKPNPEPLNAGIILHNIMKGIKDADDPSRLNPSLMMCALVILREGEDPTKFDESLMREKINDWTEEGLDMMGFIALSRSCIQGFNETLIESIQKTLESLSFEVKE
jgi:hypothetical protein